MERLVRGKIIKNLLLVLLLIYFVAAFYTMDLRRRIEVSNLDSVLNQIVIQYDKSKANEETYVELFKKDYLNRAHAVDYILKNMDKAEINQDELQAVKQMMQVEFVSMTDTNGEIILSSESEANGLNLREMESAKKFWDLIDGKEGVSEVIDFDGKSIVSKEECIFIGVKSEIPGISMIQIGIREEVLNNFVDFYKIENVIRNIPTVWVKTIFVADANTGELLAITENNEQKLVFEQGETQEEFLEKLKTQTGDHAVNVNGVYQYMKIQEKEDYLFGAAIDAKMVYRESLIELLILALILLVISPFLYLAIGRILQKYVIEDIRDTDRNIQQMMAGREDVIFSEGHSPEIQRLNALLNRWVNSYQHQSKRMTKLMDRINSNVAIFESIPNIRGISFSDKLPDILGLTDEEMEYYRNEPEAFEAYLNQLQEQKDWSDTIKLHDRHISMYVYKDEEELYGAVLDRTEEINKLNQLQSELFKTERKIYKDSLTGLVNREGMEKYIREALSSGRAGGMMMIFDLDNFKAINDHEGHQAGDEALIRFGKCLQDIFDETDLIARMGGDEFVVYTWREVTRDKLETICIQIMQQIQKKFSQKYKKYHVSVSMGVSLANGKKDTYESLYQSADSGLYTAKNQGKNTYFINGNNIKFKKK